MNRDPEKERLDRGRVDHDVALVVPVLGRE